jgi:hypothetical protein
MNRFPLRGATLAASALLCALAYPHPSPPTVSAGASQASGRHSVDKHRKSSPIDLRHRATDGSFLQNGGQWDSHALFAAQTDGLTYWISRDGVVLDYRQIFQSGKKSVAKGDVVRMALDGAHIGEVSTSKKSPIRTDFFPGGHKKPVTTYSYGEVLAQNVYPGVSMRNYFDRSKPRYDLIVKPGADAGQIHFAFTGQKNLSTDSNGNLLIGTNIGMIKQAGLTAFTLKDGKRTPVKAAFKVLSGNKVGFQIGSYDKKSELIIDPLIYGSYFGGNDVTGGVGRDSINGVVSEPDGDVFMTGWTESLNFPVVAGAYQVNLSNTRSAFVTLFRGDAYTVLYNSYFGGTTDSGGNQSHDEGDFIQLSPDGTQLWIAGKTTSIDFPLVTSASLQQTPTTGATNLFLLNIPLDATTQMPLATSTFYATYFGPDQATTDFALSGFQIAPSGNLLLAGITSGPVASAEAVNTPLGGDDVFLTMLDPTGSIVLSSRYFGGTQNDQCAGLATDPDGDFVITGTVPDPSASTGSQNLDLSQFPAYFETTNATWPNAQLLRSSDLYAAKISTAEDPLNPGTFPLNTVWSGVVGGSQADFGQGVATDNNGNVYITGVSSSFDYPRTANVIGEQNRQDTVVVTKIATDGSAFYYSTGLNTSGDTNAVGIAVDGEGKASITGTVTGTVQFVYQTMAANPCPPTGITNIGAVETTADAARSAFTMMTGTAALALPTQDGWINVISPNADQLLYGSYVGSDGNDTIFPPYVDQFGDVWVFGMTDLYFGYNVPPAPVSGTPPQPILIHETMNLAGFTGTTGFITPLAFKANPDEPLNFPADNGGTLTDPQADLGPLPFFWYTGTAPNIVQQGSVPSDGNTPYGFNPSTGIGFFPSQYPLDDEPFGPNLGLFPYFVSTFEYTDGYVLRFRVGLPVISSLTFTPTIIAGGLGQTSTGQVILSGNAPSQGVQLTLTLDNPEVAQFVGSTSPSVLNITIPSGSNSATFQVQSSAVTTATAVTCTANYQGNVKFATLNVVPWLSQFVVTPNSLVSGYTITATVKLNAAAPAGGVAVTLTADNPALISGGSPQTLTVPAGQTVVNVPITTEIVQTQTTLNLTASLLGVSIPQAVTLNGLNIGITGLTITDGNGNPVTTLNAGQIVTGTLTTSQTAPDAGLDVTVASSEPNAAYLVISGADVASGPIHIAAGANQATFTLEGGTVPDLRTTSVTATFGANTSTAPTITVNPVSFSMSLDPVSVPGGQPSSGTITIPLTATGGLSSDSAVNAADALTFTLTDNDTLGGITGFTGLDSGSTNQITIPIGSTSATFGINTGTVNSTDLVTVTATMGTTDVQTATANLTINEVGVQSIYFKRSSVRAGQTDVGFVVLDSPAPADITLNITYGYPGDVNTYFSIRPTTVTILAGQTQGSFTVMAKHFSRNVLVPVTASTQDLTTSASTNVTITR